MPVGISRIKEKRLTKEIRDQISDFRQIAPAVNQHVKLEKGVGRGEEKSETLLSIYILPVFLYIFYINCFED